MKAHALILILASVAMVGCLTPNGTTSPEPAAQLVEDREPGPPPPSPARAFINAQRAWDNPELAIEALSHAIEIDPDFAVAYFERANRFRQIGETEPALKDYSQAIRVDPGFIQAYLERGFMRLWDLGDEDGWEDIEAAYAVDPNDMEAALAFAGLIEWDDPERAFGIYDRLTELYPDHPEPFLRSAKLLRGLGDFEGAIRDFTNAVERGDGDPWIRTELAMVLLFTDREREAGSILADILKDDPENPDVALAAARLAVAENDLNRAASFYQIHLQGEWFDYSALLESAMLAAKAGNESRTEELIRRYVELSDDTLRGRLFGAGALALSGNGTEAIRRTVAVLNDADWFMPAWFMLAALARNDGPVPTEYMEKLHAIVDEIRPDLRRFLFENPDLATWLRLYGTDF